MFLGRPDRDRKKEQGTEYSIEKYDKKGLLGIFTLTTEGGRDAIFLKLIDRTDFVYVKLERERNRFV